MGSSGPTWRPTGRIPDAETTVTAEDADESPEPLAPSRSLDHFPSHPSPKWWGPCGPAFPGDFQGHMMMRRDAETGGTGDLMGSNAATGGAGCLATGGGFSMTGCSAWLDGLWSEC